jgi:hypothetical protein
MIDAATEQHRRNLKALMALPEDEYAAHRGECAVMVDGQVVSYHETARAAVSAARALGDWGEFSIQEVDKAPVEVGLHHTDRYVN